MRQNKETEHAIWNRTPSIFVWYGNTTVEDQRCLQRIVNTVDSRNNAPRCNDVPNITLIILGPRSNKKHVQ